jgi:hypothetical protein
VAVPAGTACLGGLLQQQVHRNLGWQGTRSVFRDWVCHGVFWDRVRQVVSTDCVCRVRPNIGGLYHCIGLVSAHTHASAHFLWLECICLGCAVSMAVVLPTHWAGVLLKCSCTLSWQWGHTTAVLHPEDVSQLSATSASVTDTRCCACACCLNRTSGVWPGLCLPQQPELWLSATAAAALVLVWAQCRSGTVSGLPSCPSGTHSYGVINI